MNSGPSGFNGPGGPVPSYGYHHPVAQGLPGGPNNVYMNEANNHMPRNYANEYLAAASDGSEYAGPNWPQRVMDELKDMQLVLSVDGRIKYASPSCQLITGHAVEQLVGNFLESFMHEDDKSIYKREINEAITSRHPLRFHFRFSKVNNTFSILEAYGHAHLVTRNGAAAHNNLGNRCDGFFLLCRPYPTKSAQLLDSFLEHKVENIRLSQRIAELKKEEEEDLKGSRPYYYKSEHTDSQAASSEGRSPVASLNSTQSNAASTSTTTADKTALSESAYENTNQDDSGNNTATENQPERNTRLESLAHIDGIEVLTGLYYGDGERSQGLSTGEKRARLIQCDIDITTAADQRMRSAQDGDKRKRLKGEYVCSDCGTYDSPEWRKGPNGPKTLCNACGLRWAKKEKKRQGSG